MARPTNVKTRVLRQGLRRAGFTLLRNAGGHEIWQRAHLRVRLPAGHRHVEENVLSTALKMIASARAET